MDWLIAYFVVGGIGGLYWLLSFKRKIYINAPSDVIDPDEKFKILKWHILASLIIGILLINLVLKKLVPDLYDYLIENSYLIASIIGSIIISFILIGEIIQLNLMKNNFHFVASKTILENPELLEPERNMLTRELLDENEFWLTIESVKHLVSNRNEYQKALNAELVSKGPRWLTEFFHTLINVKLELLDKKIFAIASFILRKYEQDYNDPFIEYVIAHGKEFYNHLKNDIENIEILEVDIMFISSIDITSILTDAYFERTHKVIVIQREFEENELNYVKRSPKEIKQKYPRIHSKFK